MTHAHAHIPAPARRTLLSRAAVAVLWTLIRLYQLTLAVVLPPACRFTPSCSHYAQEALQKYGVFKGLWLALKRIARCHPWHQGGYDPVP